MKKIRRDRTFEKHFKERISPNKQLVSQFKDSLELFMEGELKTLDDHALRGKLAGKRAFSTTDDIRTIYVEQGDSIVLLDVGRHNQVYK
jgi:addiction module RelE/StbE family toxin